MSPRLPDPRPGGSSHCARRHRIPLLLLAIAVTTWLAIGAVHASGRVAVAWPAAGFTAGLLLIAPERRRIPLLGAASCWSRPSWRSAAPRCRVALAFGASTALCAVIVRWRLHRKLGKARVGLLDQGDVSRLMAAVTLGAAVAALGDRAHRLGRGPRSPDAGGARRPSAATRPP